MRPSSRRRWTIEQKRQILAQFAASGISAAEFCRRTGLSVGTVARWRSKLKPAHRGSPFAEVHLAEGGVVGTKVAGAVIRFVGEIEMTVALGTDPLWVGQLVRAVRNASSA
jgi:transposase-like protein